jgi:5-methylcytosine-specific restriction endonuclease McrA
VWRNKPSSSVRRKWRTALFERQGGRCEYCGCIVTIDKAHAYAPNYGTLDHVVPRAHQGRPTSLTNMVLACRSCNHRKDSMDAETFRRMVAN